jgi:ABC-type Fe3+-hydroxamate transport system substrate-binding protein
MTINRDTYIHDMLSVCGARNIFADRPERYPTVTLDEVAARARR